MAPTKETILRLVIIGGVAGGATAAARARRRHANADITILEKGDYVSFANCGLPYHLGGEIEDRDDLLVATPELFRKRLNISVRTGHEVTRIDRKSQIVEGVRTDGEPFKVPYDRLILSPGSEPVRPPFWDSDYENVFHLWKMSDLDAILAFRKRKPVRKAVVVGAGFVGLEVVEQLERTGVDVSLVELSPQVLAPLDPEMAQFVLQKLKERSIDVRLGASVERLLASKKKVNSVNLSNDETLATELVIVGAGVRPRTQLAMDCGLEIGETGAIAVNASFQTSDPKIYAVGDAAEYHHGVLNAKTRMPLAGPANRAGRIAGEHAVRENAADDGESSNVDAVAPLKVYGTSIVRVFDMTAGITGLSEKAAARAGIKTQSVYVQATHHASYFPGAEPLVIKLTVARETARIVGMQAVGGQGVDKRLDVIATLMHFGGQVSDLAQLDLAYAPPYGSAKDPLHMAAFVASNTIERKPDVIAPAADLTGYQVVDVRTAKERESLPLPNAIAIEVDSIRDGLEQLDPNKPTVVVCHSGKRAHVAASWLAGQGFDSIGNLTGGMMMRSRSGV